MLYEHIISYGSVPVKHLLDKNVLFNYNVRREEGWQLSSRIREARKAAGITQAELAAKIGINRATLSKYESGIIEPPISQLKLIAEKLGEYPGSKKVYWYELSSESVEKAAATAASDALDAVIKFGGANTFEDKKEGDARRSVRFNSNEDRISYFYSCLNNEGRRVAADRIQELAEIPKYQNKEKPQQPE